MVANLNQFSCLINNSYVNKLLPIQKKQNLIFINKNIKKDKTFVFYKKNVLLELFIMKKNRKTYQTLSTTYIEVVISVTFNTITTP